MNSETCYALKTKNKDIYIYIYIYIILIQLCNFSYENAATDQECITEKKYYGRDLLRLFVLQSALRKLPLVNTSVCLSTSYIATKVQCTIPGL
jgi:hypothetical protein